MRNSDYVHMVGTHVVDEENIDLDNFNLEDVVDMDNAYSDLEELELSLGGGDYY
jgi:hypothetical protein